MPEALTTASSGQLSTYKQRPFTAATNWKLALTRLATAYGPDVTVVAPPGTLVVRHADHALLLTAAPGHGPGQSQVTLVMAIQGAAAAAAPTVEAHAASFEAAVKTVRGCLRTAEEDQAMAEAGQALPVLPHLAVDGTEWAAGAQPTCLAKGAPELHPSP
jgi:hypothetical protein